MHTGEGGISVLDSVVPFYMYYTLVITMKEPLKNVLFFIFASREPPLPLV